MTESEPGSVRMQATINRLRPELPRFPGLTVPAAEALATELDATVRVIDLDGDMIITADYRPDRINLHVRNATVIEADLG